jgi:hypothetical protein
MVHETAQLYLQPGADRAALADALRATPGHCAPNLAGCWGAGDFTWDASGPTSTSMAARLQALPGVARVDHVHYDPIASGMRAPELRHGVKRTLLLRVQPHAPAPAVAALEHALQRMPRYLSGIRNWSLGRVCSDSRWTHVWQQEFASVDELLGEYMAHPYHWAWVDRWFDPECPQRIVDTALSHAFCRIESSVLARSPQPI